jgi:hypothetical protein
VTDSRGTLKSLVVVLNTDRAMPTPASCVAPAQHAQGEGGGDSTTHHTPALPGMDGRLQFQDTAVSHMHVQVQPLRSPLYCQHPPPSHTPLVPCTSSPSRPM